MDFGALFAPFTAWMDSHPATIAWLSGWVAALSLSQIIKQALPPTWSVTAVKRVMQLVAMLGGGSFAFILWPTSTGHPLAFALLVGMSAPSAYTLIKAVAEWQFPRLAYLLGWERIQDRNDVPHCDQPPEPGP